MAMAEIYGNIEQGNLCLACVRRLADLGALVVFLLAPLVLFLLLSEPLGFLLARALVLHQQPLALVVVHASTILVALFVCVDTLLSRIICSAGTQGMRKIHTKNTMRRLRSESILIR